jgi:uncharacterized membrane protein YkvA (DUF1232 family)
MVFVVSLRLPKLANATLTNTEIATGHLSYEGMYMFDRLKSIRRDLKRELKVYKLLLKDSRTPKLSKFLLGLALGYTLFPFDIIPDFIPVIGYLDDVIIVGALVFIARKMIPKGVVEDCRIRANGV